MPRLTNALLGVLLAGSAIAHAESNERIACHLGYGGDSSIVEARPTASPYTVAPVDVGSYLQFRIVFRTEPADLASIKLYAYGNYEDSRSLIQQATYHYPPLVHDRSYGFTGLHRVYEPRYGLELEYWCELKQEISK